MLYLSVPLLIAVSSLSAAVGESLAPHDPLQECYSELYAEHAQLNACNNAAQSSDVVVASKALSVLAMGQAAKGELAQARQYMQQALANGTQSAVVVGNHANLLLLEKKYADAINAFDQALGLADVDQAFVYLNRSLALRGLGDYAGAREDYQQYLRLRSAPMPEF